MKESFRAGNTAFIIWLCFPAFGAKCPAFYNVQKHFFNGKIDLFVAPKATRPRGHKAIPGTSCLSG